MAVYSMEGTQKDCYPDTTVLVNKLGIKKQEELNSIERQFVLLRSSQVEKEAVFEKTGKLKFQRLAELNYLKKLNKSTFLDELSELYHDLNMLLPFREGNGRTLRLFITLLVRNAGYNLNFSECDSDLLMIATIKAAQGDISLLREVFA